MAEQPKVYQESIVKQSVVEPARKLSPVFATLKDGTVISEQEIMQRKERDEKLTRELREEEEHIEAWIGMSPPEILLMEMVKKKPIIKNDPTLSIHPMPDGTIDVHLYGRTHRVLPHIVKFSNDSVTWHVTARGVLQALERAAVRPDVAREMLQHEVYQEQADLLRELARVGGYLEEEKLSQELGDLEKIPDQSMRWKTEVNLLFLLLRKKIGALVCQSPQQSQPQPQPQKAPATPKPRQRRRRATPPAAPVAEASQTT